MSISSSEPGCCSGGGTRRETFLAPDDLPPRVGPIRALALEGLGVALVVLRETGRGGLNWLGSLRFPGTEWLVELILADED